MNIRDDRGHWVTARTGAPGSKRATPPLTDSVVRIILFATAGAAVSFFAWMGIVLMQLNANSQSWGGITIMIMMFMAGPILSGALGVFFSGQRGRQTHGIPTVCPACAYRLNGLDAEADGCCVCPECSAAWQIRIADYPHVPTSHSTLTPSVPPRW